VIISPSIILYIKKIGALCSAAEIGVDRSILEDELIRGKDYRGRYIRFKTAAELGILEKLVAKVMAIR
jgi:hypothetical protein